MSINLLHGDCLEQMKTLPDNSVDAIVTDPPYGLSFMGKKWDYDVPAVNIWEECFRVLKPGGHLLAFAGTRTQHRMAVNIEDAGFEIRDMIAWVYGSGFPKSHNISKAIDKVGSPEAQQWDGWGTALKPALEPITVARKPVAEKSIAGNVLKYGTGGLNVDGCRVETDPSDISGWSKTGSKASENRAMSGANYDRPAKPDNPQGRFPANLIHDGSDEVVELAGDSARFFYCAKASKKDRDEGLDHMEEQQFVQWQTGNGASGKPSSMSEGRDTKRKNTHPTVKPTDLMKYLVRMVTPKGGVVLDPFMGSGSTGKAAKLEGFDFIGIEMDEEYFLLAKSRIDGIMVESTLEDFFK